MKASSSTPPVSFLDPLAPSKAMSYESFKPKFPLDPFSASVSSRAPWTLDPGRLPPLALSRLQRNVILLIGVPSAQALSPLFTSAHLASSLVILATHAPPAIPSIVQPTIRILRLSTPLEIENAGASRLVEVLEWAERVARTWRCHSDGGIEELFEPGAPRDSTRKPPSSFRLSAAPTPPENIPLSSSQDSTGARSASTPALVRSPSISSLKMLRRKSKAPALPLPPADPSQRPFDAIMNFLPAGVPDKLVLKHAILVTTITRPYLVPNAAGIARPSGIESRMLMPKPYVDPTRRWSLFAASPIKDTMRTADYRIYSRSLASQSRGQLDSVLPSFTSLSELPGNALSTPNSRIIHVLPSLSPPRPAARPSISQQAYARLIRSIETFLLTFVMTPSAQLPGDPFLPPTPTRPYVVEASALGDVLSTDTDAASNAEWCLSDIILAGLLDSPTSRITPAVPASGKGKQPEMPKIERRAWIAGISDIVLSSPRIRPPPRAYSPSSEPATPPRAASPLKELHRLPTPPDDRVAKPLPMTPVMPPAVKISAPTSRTGTVAPSRSVSATRSARAHRPLYGLPTPPDSDEASIEEIEPAKPLSAAARHPHVSPPKPQVQPLALGRPRSRTESDPHPFNATVTKQRMKRSGRPSALAAEADEAKKAPRWMFWKRVVRSAVAGEV